ncbi:MAG: COX15/CtaA family protein [candidate division NC10 bacterium]
MAQGIRPVSNHTPWVHRFALFTTGATFILLIAGGLVTSTGSGLAVPDWPTTFGYSMFRYPWSKMVGGILVEHGHRLIGAGVGLLTLTLALWLWVTEPRGWLRWLGVGALVGVVVQGVLGGLRVVFIDRTLAIVHAALAQAFFALTATLAFFTSQEGKEAPRKMQTADAGRLRHFCLLTTSVIYLQLIVGGVLRHTGVGVGVHLLFAGVVTIQVLFLAVLILRGYRDQPRLVRPITLLSALLILQLVVGLGAYGGKFTSLGVGLSFHALVALTTAHVATGALMLATCLVLTLRVYRGLTPRVPAAAQEFVPSHPAGMSEKAPA